ncbi:MAG: 2Fe-2S iron-sulfur cluster-binding protein [Pirellulaceae bacterium]|nr:2Fe-2S iron-sulfur cluster-binding protein [Pirellulaceae bacterium]MDP6553866.1 2Fe-2S iron-sulfur cluster-binding protein [Pirellulaceae bacterium]
MATVIVDGQEIELGEGERLNGIQAAARAGIEIPHYCWHPGLSVVASCRMCLVESGRKTPEGEIQMVPKLVPACQTPATDGSVFVTNSEKVVNARAMVEEDLLIRHPVDCPICDKAGECHLQDYHFEYGRDQRRADIRPFTSRRRELGETVTLFVDRCVMCTRCVRFTREISGASELFVANRGAHEEIEVFPGFPLDNKMSGNVVDLCPVGALGDRDFLYQQRVWFMKSHDNVCAGCSTGCSVKVEENQDQVYRLKPRVNPHINQWWMCDEGRYGLSHIHDPQRLTEPKRQVGDDYVNVQWPQVPTQLDESLRSATRIAVVLSPHLAVEEAYLLAIYVRQIDPDAVLAVGRVPAAGEDESFPNGFTIRAEKCPNRKGVEAIVTHLGETLLTWDDFLARLDQGDIDAAWVTGGYTSDWIDGATAARFSSLKTLIVQDLFASPLWDRATYQLPGASFAEREGSYVNHADRLQSFRWAVRPPAGVMVEGQLYWRLLERIGLYNAREVLADMSRELVYFSAAAPDVSEHGVDLKVNQLAAV